MPPQRPWKTRSPERADPGCRQMVVKEPELRFRLFLFHATFTCKLWSFPGWACLDSNQGPLPYQRSKTPPPLTAIDRNFLQKQSFCPYDPCGCSQLHVRVAAPLLHSCGARIRRCSSFDPIVAV